MDPMDCAVQNETSKRGPLCAIRYIPRRGKPHTFGILVDERSAVERKTIGNMKSGSGLDALINLKTNVPQIRVIVLGARS